VSECEFKGKRKKKIVSLCDVEVEEICVQEGLDGPRNPDNPVNIPLGVVAVDPVDQVQATVEAKGKEVMGVNSLSLSCNLEHVKLGEDGHSLQPDGERPKDLSEEERGRGGGENSLVWAPKKNRKWSFPKPQQRCTRRWQ